MNILGLDIGYSNLKMAYGLSGQAPVELIVPSGSAPASALPHGIRLTEEGTAVLNDGEAWRIGLSHGRFDQWSRALHENYSDAPSYRALFHGALVLSGKEKIDKIVTGLPVRHWQDLKIRNALTEKLTGRHEVTRGLWTDVEMVEVIPQPLGAYLEMLWRSDGDALVLSEGRILVVDPGYYSVDWVLIEGGTLRKSGSGSSLDAMSVLIRDAIELIKKDLKGEVGAHAIEDALRRDRADVLLFGEPVPIDPYLRAASKGVAKRLVEQLREALRRETGSLDVIILAGGGAPYYREALTEIFGQSRMMMSIHPEKANARGFFFFGEM